MSFDLDGYLADLRGHVDRALRSKLPPPGREDPLRLRAAMAASLLEGGKRLRPCLTLAACQAVGTALERALSAACALEMVHAYSLVHDDLPAMDNDDLRRGQPTCHKRFGEATAILTGDALLTHAFEVLSEETPDAPAPALRLRACQELARAAGARGMVGGQAMDLALQQTLPGAASSTAPGCTFEQLELCQSGKTAALFSAATAIGALLGGGSEAQIEELRSYGFDAGLAFQHADDLRDHEFVAHRERALARAVELAQRAGRAAARYGELGLPLVALAEWIERRARESSPITVTN